MDPAVNQAINNANQATNTSEWVLFTFVVIAPLFLLFIMVPVAILAQRKSKCPDCGNWRKNKLKGRQIVKAVEGNKTIITKQRIFVCRKCKKEFAA